MSSETILRVQGLSKCFEIYDRPIHRLYQTLCAGHRNFYKEFWALRDVNFEVKKGECVGIIGRNGAGKSTLLQLITGTLGATSGTVETHGKIAALLELGSGFNMEFTGRENVYMNAAILGLTTEEIDQRYQEILDFADIGDFINQPVKTYSSGMQIRLAFAVQVLVQPDILIVDEALAVGDIFFQQKCLRKISQMVEAGATVLLVTHDMGTLVGFCSRAIYLKSGTVAAIGPAAEIAEKYQNDTTSTSRDHFAIEDNGNMAPEEQEKFRFRINPDFQKNAAEVSGSGEVEFTSMDFYTQEGKEIHQCFPRDEITVVVSMIAVKDIPSGAAAGLLCTNKDNVPLFGINTDCYGFYFTELTAGEHYTISWTFKMPVNPGQYIFSLGLKPDPLSSYFYKRMFSVAVLNVVPNPNAENLNTGWINVPKASFKLEKAKKTE